MSYNSTYGFYPPSPSDYKPRGPPPSLFGDLHPSMDRDIREPRSSLFDPVESESANSTALRNTPQHYRSRSITPPNEDSSTPARWKYFTGVPKHAIDPDDPIQRERRDAVDYSGYPTDFFHEGQGFFIIPGISLNHASFPGRDESQDIVFKSLYKHTTGIPGVYLSECLRGVDDTTIQNGSVMLTSVRSDIYPYIDVWFMWPGYPAWGRRIKVWNVYESGRTIAYSTAGFAEAVANLFKEFIDERSKDTTPITFEHMSHSLHGPNSIVWNNIRLVRLMKMTPTDWVAEFAIIRVKSKADNDLAKKPFRTKMVMYS